MLAAVAYLILSDYGLNLLGTEPEENNVVTNDIANEEKNTTNNQANNAIDEEPTKDEFVKKLDIPNKVGGYEVIGQLVINKIGVKENILAIWDDVSLELGIVSMIKGPIINQSGNLCIAGHRLTIFKNIASLKEGDTFYIISKKDKRKVTYQIYDISTCDPDDLSSLAQDTGGKREVTIITCTLSGAKRVVCKARET